MSIGEVIALAALHCFQYPHAQSESANLGCKEEIIACAHVVKERDRGRCFIAEFSAASIYGVSDDDEQRGASDVAKAVAPKIFGERNK